MSEELRCRLCGEHPCEAVTMIAGEYESCPHPCHAIARELVDAAVAWGQGLVPVWEVRPEPRAESVALAQSVDALLASLREKEESDA